MWKPSKRLVTWILIILLIWNLGALAYTYIASSRLPVVIDGISRYKGTPHGMYVESRYDEVSWWDTEMSKVDNSPRIIVSVGRGFVEALSPSDDVSSAGLRIQRVGDNIQLDMGGTLGSGSEMRFAKYDLLKNFFVPWMLDKTEYYVTNEGRFENLILVGSIYEVLLTDGDNVTGIKRWENLDFVYANINQFRDIPQLIGYSPWGAIHLGIVLGALIYVKKRWH